MIHADLECLVEKMHSCQNNPEKSCTEKKIKHAPSGYSLFPNCSFDEKRKQTWLLQRWRLYHEVRNHCHYTKKFTVAAHGICNLRYKTPKEILIVFHNGSTYDYHFIVNKLPKEFYGHLECLFFLQRNILLFQ